MFEKAEISFRLAEPVWIRNEGKIEGRKQGNVLFNDALIIFDFRLYGKEPHSDREQPLSPLHGLIVPISNKGSLICTILQTGEHTP